MKTYFIGPCGGGKIPTNGASMKNFQIVNYFRREGIKMTVIDTEKWKKDPRILLRLFFIIFLYNGRFIVSANNTSSYRLLSILTMYPFKRFIAYWVIGGSIADWIKSGRVKPRPFSKADLILVEGERMKNVFNDCGINRVKIIPNFKAIDYIPRKSYAFKDAGVKFVFLSRVIREKGTEIIIDAVKELNKRISGFSVAFYGPLDEGYREEFTSSLRYIKNITYNGCLDMMVRESYNELSKYDVMLFPTYWHGEGFPGIFIDAFIAGLPVIATDWSMNGEIIKDGENGWLIPPHDAMALANVMESIVENKKVLEIMTQNCQQIAHRYDINSVINRELLMQLGFVK